MNKSQIVLIVCFSLLVAPYASAGPICGNVETDPETGSKTWHALKNWLHPMCKFITEDLPGKTPSDIADGAKETAKDVKTWVEENSYVQGLNRALNPVKSWLQDTRDTLKDKSFKEMYEDVKVSVQKMDNQVGAWISTHVDGNEKM